MPTNTNKILQKITSKAGWQNGLVTRQFNKKPGSSKFAFQYYIANTAFNDSTLNLDAIYFTDTTPIIYIKELSSYDRNLVIELHKRFWNECRTPLTLIITPNVIKILDNYAKPVNNPNEISQIERETFKTTDEDLERLAEILKQSKLDSEKVFGYEFNLSINQRVDKKLISQLREARKQLHDKYKLSLNTIHDLLGRSLFTLYLEQREILTKKDIKAETKVADNFFDLLKQHPKETYTLFAFLKEKFNGDLFPITAKEETTVIKNPNILNLIYECFTHETDLRTGQKYLFNFFDFKHIPIELISAIYEEFMSEEDVTKNIIIDNKAKGKRELGAYYTPQMLVEFVYNEVLPMPSKNDYNYKLKILDPACGSGIFLVEGFKRIIERWKYSNNQTELSKETLSELLLNSIYGVEIHPEAIKITAFSLYLTFLHHMNPKEILRKVKFNPLVYWTKQEEAEQREEKKFGANLLQANTFIREGKKFKANPIEKVNSFFANKFDIVIGNPPWKRSNVDDEILTWAKQQRWDVEGDIVKGFLAYAPTIAPDAKIALISSAKVLFNTSGTDDDFRIRFFSENKVSVVVNFSVVRHVLFEKAKQAAALLIYKPRKKSKFEETETIIYCVPKTSLAIQNRNTITIDASEIKYLPVIEVLKPNSKIFKIAMYGNLRDLKFINRLNRMKPINQQDVLEGMGLIKDKDAESKGNTRLAENCFIETTNILSYYTPKNKTKFKDHPDYSLFRTDSRDLYTPPLLLFKEGTRLGQISCSYIDYKCVFLSSAKGIKFKNKDEAFHKSFIACLNSSLATYFYISVCSNWGVSKGGQIQKNEISLFPAIPFYLNENAIQKLSQKVDDLIAIYNSTKYEDMLIRKRIKPIQDDIDNIIYHELKITKAEQALVENVLSYSNVLKENYKNSGAENPVSFGMDIKQYTQTYLDTVNRQFKDSSIRLISEIYPNSNQRNELVCVKFIFEKSRSTKNEIEESKKEISNVLHEINESTFKEHSASIYYRRIIKYDLRNAFYLIKPNEKRFWSKAAALNDADNLIVEILNQRNN
jgi:N-6 DNA Methylase